MNSANEYDIIIIGSGMGALTAASILAQLENKRVLMLEKHFKAGGFTHTFKRKGKFHWDVGIHYIGDVGKGGMQRKLFDLITRRKLKWNRMPELFEKYVFPDFTFDLYSGESRFKTDLYNMFPKEKQAILDYFTDCKALAAWYSRHVSLKTDPEDLEQVSDDLTLLGKGHGLMTTGEYLDNNFNDQRLKAVLASQWGNYGLPPRQSSMLIHALTITHYFNGGFYPKGSSEAIAAGITKIIEDKGGKILLYHQAEEILIKDNKAVGVRTLDIHKPEQPEEKIFHAPVIISNAGAYNTYNQLLPAGIAEDYKTEIKEFGVSPSNVTLFLGFKESPAKLGFQGENHWIFSSYDHDKNFEERNQIISNSAGGCYLSFPSLKDPEFAGEGHTGEVIAFVDYEPFKKWENQDWLKKDEEYNKLKEHISQSLIERVDALYPGFKDLICFQELSTPLTNRHFTNHPNGSIYGVLSTPDRFRKKWTRVRTPVENLYMAGADVSTSGIAGAMMGGFAAANIILGGNGLSATIKRLSRVR